MKVFYPLEALGNWPSIASIRHVFCFYEQFCFEENVFCHLSYLAKNMLSPAAVGNNTYRRAVMVNSLQT
jgi:hypothetical protein